MWTEKARKFSNICWERSEICKHCYGVLTLTSLLKGCVATVKEKMGKLICIQCKTTSCFLYIRKHKLPDICILVSWKNEEVPRRVPSNIQRFSRRKMFSEKKRWIFQISCVWHENSGFKIVFDFSGREVH